MWGFLRHVMIMLANYLLERYLPRPHPKLVRA